MENSDTWKHSDIARDMLQASDKDIYSSPTLLLCFNYQGENVIYWMFLQNIFECQKYH